ncbi:MAG: hypothetical protein JWQ95_4046 [Sphaerisporangium sp.]|nr:hypothetical protein [Sphaerisporangium sp.]
MFWAAAAATIPIAYATSTAIITRCLPYRSPMRPRSGVSTALESRKALRIQADQVGVVSSSRSSNRSAGTTTVCMRA